MGSGYGGNFERMGIRDNPRPIRLIRHAALPIAQAVMPTTVDTS